MLNDCTQQYFVSKLHFSTINQALCAPNHSYRSNNFKDYHEGIYLQKLGPVDNAFVVLYVASIIWFY